MTQDRTLFTFPTVGPKDPLTGDPFYAWLDANEDRRDPDSFMDALLEYLKTLGFDKEQHIIDEGVLDTLKYVREQWLLLTPFFPPQSMQDLFSDKKTPKYFVKGIKEWNDPHSGITEKLQNMVNESGWIYMVWPETTYFEVIGDRLYAKYHQILGSRFICRIKELK
jgi:hypothetical protein